MGISCIRGAITVEKNLKDNILHNTNLLIDEIISKNRIDIDNIISIIFTTTKDLDSAYPAVACRNMGIVNSALMCLQEQYVKDSLTMCIRVMVTVSNTYSCQKNVNHIYLKGAKILRPDIMGSEKFFSVAIDGPAGSGKSTVAKKVAKKLNFLYIDTGAMYRSVALYYIKNNLDYTNRNVILKYLTSIKINLFCKDNVSYVYLNNEDVTDLIRTQEVANVSSIIAKVNEVREKLVEIQREISKGNNIIMDGRDIGSYVLKNANIKIYLDADPHIRAVRRCNELQENNQNFDFEEVKKEIIRRDFNDKNREYSPLVKAEDATLINSSELTIIEVENVIINLIKEKYQD